MDNEVNYITIIDDNENEHVFEELDRIETEDGNKYIALIPADDEDDEECELIFLKVIEENDANYLEPITDDKLFDEIADIFTERLRETGEYDFSD